MRPDQRALASATPREGFRFEGVFNLAKNDRLFLPQVKELVNFEEESAETRNEGVMEVEATLCRT